MKNKFLALIQDSQKIFITSHVSPDPDAICSALLLANTLNENFPDKKIMVCLEEKPAKDVSFLTGYDQIMFKPLFPTVESFSPDLFVMLDANNFERVSRKNGQKVKRYLDEHKIKSVTVDHHQPEGKDDVDLYINNGDPATVQNIYEICFKELKLKKPDGYGDITMLGILDDTGRFMYENTKHQQTLNIVNELIDSDVNIETLWNRLTRYTKDQLEVVSQLIGNVVVDDGYTYSFLDDDFCKQWFETKGEPTKLKGAVDWFKDNFLRSIDGNNWGFVAYQDPSEKRGVYSVSFRAINGTRDVAALARKLDGGGHKAAAGGHISASSIKEAIQKVKAII